jgi:plasmid stabilization system protein ParE
LTLYRVVFSRRVRAQLGNIRNYLSVHADGETAERIVGALVNRCLELDTFPDRGTLHEELGKGVRTVPFRRNATIGYVVAETDVIIIGLSWRGQPLERAIRHPGSIS